MIVPVASLSIWVFVKTAALILLAIYLVFALVVVRQTRLMTDTLQLGFETPIKLLSYAHLVFAVFVFLTALIVL